ncbi:hypothetical protein OE88DRAFT_1733665 [Heliocybe sulcata]|uniref:Ricin B lectin domain-containing protein n=1 Tax=Heliocybe sulcata TaxID=5364 RepID=A0A5C3N7K9_9AGAM|nr:hypothetical protein OE88DRAFT_1733665 [Heliocybe sulcata]
MLSVSTFTTLALLPFVFAAPTMKRAEVCDISSLQAVSIVTSGDNSGQVRWDLFQDSGYGIQAGELAWFKESNPDEPATFSAVPSSNGQGIFSFQRQTDFQQVVQSGNGFSAAGSGGTEFIVSCNAECNTGAASTQLAAGGCTMEIADGTGKGTGNCITYGGGDQTPVTISQCNGSASQSITFYAAGSSFDEDDA